ncbi:transaldolase [Candidatus Gottesmanbacteria bacterium]|nr:transaldolase [Candidatus Gottesmanbacteria bacterium]
MPKNISSKIFIDGGSPQETRQAKVLLGFLDGQTTNPSLIAKNYTAKAGGTKLTETQALDEYKRVVRQMSGIIPEGSISIQVFAQEETKADEMLRQARARKTWIPNHSIKFPCTKEGLTAAEIACKEMPVNITLVFSQSQAAAVYEATKGAKYPVFISPFVGRLDDRGENGMQVVENILEMYTSGDGHVEVLTASLRGVDHILYALRLGSDIITCPFKVFKTWADGGFTIPDTSYVYPVGKLKPIPYKEDITLGKPWQEYNISHDLTTIGIAKFWEDWNSLLQ